MSIAALQDIPRLVEDLITGRKKAVTYGWPEEMGKQGQFLSVALEYAVPSDGRLRPGFQPKKNLGRENPQSTVILSCEGSMEATYAAVREIGDFTVINGFTYDYISRFFPALLTLPHHYRRTRKVIKARRGILVRGSAMGDYGFQALQKLAHDYPDDYIVVSIWDTTPLVEQERLASVCDRLILNKQPSEHGLQTCNLQLAVIQPGLKAMQEAGVERILMVRTDYLFGNPYMLDQFDVLLSVYPSDVARAHGLRGRLLVADIGSRRYLPYHPGDMLTYGYAEDVVRYWTRLTHDTRSFDIGTYGQHAHQSMWAVARLCPVNETYFTTSFMQDIKREADWTIEDSYAFHRDFLIVTSYIANGMFWFKKLWYDQVSYLRPAGQYLTQQAWTAFLSGRPLKDFVEINVDKTSWDQFTGCIAT